MIQRISHYVRAGYSGLYLVSPEEARVEAALVGVINLLNSTKKKNVADDPWFKLFAWSVTEGILDVGGKNVVKAEAGPDDMLVWFNEAPANTILLARDFHLYVENPNPMLWRRVRDVVAAGRGHNKTLVILGCRLTLPPELEKEITVLDFPLPDRDQIQHTLDQLVTGNSIPASAVDDRQELVSSAAGLTLTEADQAFALSIVETGRISKGTVFREKCQAVRKNGLLEIVESKVTLDDVGGLEHLKKWLLERREAFGDDAKAYQLPEPKGILAVGQPGTGKSLISKACRSVFDIPLLRLDAGKLFGSLVGQSEGNWRTAHATAKAMAPCILWIDEADGAFSGSKSSGQTDGGTTARVIKSILQDMQENSHGIFFVLTANDIDGLPAPLLRRMDEVWNVDLPTVGERELIWRIQIKKGHRDPADFDLAELALKTSGYSGAEIEKIVSQALFRGFADGKREPVMADFLEILAGFHPLSETMAEDIAARKKRLANVAKPAGGEVKLAVAKPVRRIAPIGGRAAA